MATSLIAGAAGLILGWLVALIWMSISARMGEIDFWPAFRRLTRSLLCTVDPRAFRDNYIELLILLGRYLARNAVLTAGASLPVILFVLFVAPVANAGGHFGAAGAATSVLPSVHAHAASSWVLWSAAGNWPEIMFYTGIGLASSLVVLLRHVRSR